MEEPQQAQQEEATVATEEEEVVETNPFRRESFQPGNMRVVGEEEKRWPDDHPDPQRAGGIKAPASVALVFAQMAQIPGLMPAPDGNGAVMAMSVLHVAEYVARGIEPDTAIAIGQFLQEEGERVKATMRHPDGDPALKARQSGLIVAGAGSEDQAARALDPETIAGNGSQKK